jgi:hypothetical protein
LTNPGKYCRTSVAGGAELLSKIAVSGLDGRSCACQYFTCLMQAEPTQIRMISSRYPDGKRHECAQPFVRPGHVYPESSAVSAPSRGNAELRQEPLREEKIDNQKRDNRKPAGHG